MTASARIKHSRRKLQPKLHKAAQLRCVYGSDSGQITVTGTQYVWARENISTNSDSSTRYGEAFQVLPAAGIAIPAKVGQPILVGLSIGGELQITGNDVETFIKDGGKPRVLNPFDPYNKFVYMRNADLALTYPTGTDNTDSLVLYVKPIIYVDSDGNTQSISDKTPADMTAFVASTADKKVLGCVFIDTVNNAITIKASSEIANDEVFGMTELDECVQAAPARSMLLSAWSLAEGATNIREEDFVVDGRQWLNVPERKDNYIATTAPTVNDDIDLNYEVGSVWIDTTNDRMYICIDSTDGAAIWHTYVKLDGDTMTGQLLLSGDARVIKEIQVKAQGFTLGPTAPTAAIIGNFFVLQFSGVGTTDTVYTSFHVPTDWAVGTDINIHIHWAPINANAGDVKWQLTWDAVASDANEVISGAGTTTSVVDSTQTLQDELLETDNMTIAGASLTAEDTIGMRIFRDPADGADTYASSASLVLIEISYTADKLGEAV